MKTPAEPHAPEPSTGPLTVLNLLFMVAGVVGGGLIIAGASGPMDNLMMAYGAASILLALMGGWTVSLVIETRREIYALRLEASLAADAQAWLISQATAAAERAQRHGECLDWIVQRLGAEEAPAAPAAPAKRVLLPVS